MLREPGSKSGLILKGIGGFYYVKTADSVLECKAKGLFRLQGITPLAGDYVDVGESGGDYFISHIYDRENSFKRPPISNVDNFFLVVSSVEPSPNMLVIDRMTVLCEQRDLKPVIIVTKTDLKEAQDVIDLYSSIGYEVIDVMKDEQAAVDRIREICSGRISVFSGNSGVGKSTFMNKLCPELSLATREISQKLGRGKHTTRAVELYEFEDGYIADTPGFSALDFERDEKIDRADLASFFPEIAEHSDGCFFTGCSHTVEKGCMVLEALNEGLIHPSRHQNYCYLYDEALKIEKARYN